MEELLPIAEGLLFLVGDEGITEELMAKSLEISEDIAQQLLDSLQKKYQDDSFGMEGIVVVAQGAGHDFVVDEITQAVNVLFDIPVHKIKVVKMDD